MSDYDLNTLLIVHIEQSKRLKLSIPAGQSHDHARTELQRKIDELDGKREEVRKRLVQKSKDYEHVVQIITASLEELKKTHNENRVKELVSAQQTELRYDEAEFNEEKQILDSLIQEIKALIEAIKKIHASKNGEAIVLSDPGPIQRIAKGLSLYRNYASTWRNLEKQIKTHEELVRAQGDLREEILRLLSEMNVIKGRVEASVKALHKDHAHEATIATLKVVEHILDDLISHLKSLRITERNEELNEYRFIINTSNNETKEIRKLIGTNYTEAKKLAEILLSPQNNLSLESATEFLKQIIKYLEEMLKHLESIISHWNSRLDASARIKRMIPGEVADFEAFFEDVKKAIINIEGDGSTQGALQYLAADAAAQQGTNS